MSKSEHDPEKLPLEQELRIQRQIAFASGLFQGDVTIRTLLESLAEGVVIIDSHGTILLVNTQAERMFGYPKNELIGMPHAVLLPERLRQVHGDHVSHYFEDPRIRPMGELLDLVGRRKDGNEFPVEISLSFLNTINGCFGLSFISDISHRKEAEARLRESEERFRILLEGVKDYAIFMLDPRGNVLSWNAGAERIKGYRPEEIIGRHFSCFYPEEERMEGKPEKELAILQKEGRFESEGWRMRKDGSRFWADVAITALFDGNGSLCGFSNVVRDITLRKRAEEEIEALNSDLAARAAEMEAANVELEAFNYMVAHDLRAPLNTISGFCQVVQNLCGDKLDEECKGYVQEIYDDTMRMDRLISTLLNFSRTLRVEMHHDTVDLGGVARGVAASLERTEPERPVTFRIAKGVKVNGDGGLLHIVLDNLIGNAWKFSENRQGTIIEFGVTEVKGERVFFVRDNGPGFDMAEADKLFVPFKRLIKSKVHGHGIGLATVERIIRRHGGRVWAEGEPGRGATFFFTLSADSSK